jgi:osmotically-inducible protein OsmY
MDDKALRQNIIDELDFEPSINAANIGVAVEKGVVTLTGHVESYAEKIAAERAVERVRGVRAVAQEIEVRYAGHQRRADDEIAQRSLDIINWSVQVPSDSIKVEVEHGWITLRGSGRIGGPPAQWVPWSFQHN